MGGHHLTHRTPPPQREAPRWGTHSPNILNRVMSTGYWTSSILEGGRRQADHRAEQSRAQLQGRRRAEVEREQAEASSSAPGQGQGLSPRAHWVCPSTPHQHQAWSPLYQPPLHICCSPRTPGESPGFCSLVVPCPPEPLAWRTQDLSGSAPAHPQPGTEGREVTAEAPHFRLPAAHGGWLSGPPRFTRALTCQYREHALVCMCHIWPRGTRGSRMVFSSDTW